MSDAYGKYRHTPAHTDVRRARDFLLANRSDHDKAYGHFQWPRPRYFNWALEWFDVIAAANDSPALQFLEPDGEGETVSFAELSSESDRTAVWLRAAGIERGDRVLVILGQQRELWECLLACLKIGAVVVPVYTSLTRVEAADRIRRGRISHVICRDDLTSLIDVGIPGLRVAVPGSSEGWISYGDRGGHQARFFPGEPTPADDIAFCYFTSGTTSAPKLVAHTHASYPIGHLSSFFWNGLRPGDRHVNVSAPGWAKHSWSSLFVPWIAEATIVVPPLGAFDPATLPTLLREHGVTSFCAPSSAWRALLPYLGTAPPALREATSAGEPLSEQIIEQVASAWDVTVREGYGQSETTAILGTSPGLPQIPGRVGKPLPGYRVTLLGEDGSPDAEHGEICVEVTGQQPVGLMTGYLDDNGSVRPAAPQGSYRTGDIGSRDPDGYIRLLGRTDDVFKSFDHRISPYELETALKAHPLVRDAAVVPKPHPVGGATPHAVVELVSGAAQDENTAAELLRHCASRLAPELRPRSVDFIASLPRTASGKVRRAALR